MLSLIPAACAALVCAGATVAPAPAPFAAPLPFALAAAVTASSGDDCTARAAAAARRGGGPLAWLMRYARDEDEPERTRVAAPISYYLRSPLLTSFFGAPPCPPSADSASVQASSAVETCAAVVVRGRGGEDVLAVGLPQYGATTAARLRAVVSDHQARGEALHFALAGDAEIEVPANAIREVRAGDCR